MLVRLANGKATFFDYREMAPGKFSRSRAPALAAAIRVRRFRDPAEPRSRQGDRRRAGRAGRSPEPGWCKIVQ